MKMARCLKSVMALLMAFVLVVPINSMVCMASKTNDAYQVMNAEAYDEASGTYALGTDQTTNDTYVKDISADNTYFIYKGVDFGEDMQSEKLTIRGSSGRSSESQPSVIIEIREGTKDGALLGTVDFIVTGGWFNFQEQTFDFNGLTGTHDLCFVFKKAGMYFDYFQFTLI